MSGAKNHAPSNGKELDGWRILSPEWLHEPRWTGLLCICHCHPFQQSLVSEKFLLFPIYEKPAYFRPLSSAWCYRSASFRLNLWHISYMEPERQAFMFTLYRWDSFRELSNNGCPFKGLTSHNEWGTLEAMHYDKMPSPGYLWSKKRFILARDFGG